MDDKTIENKRERAGSTLYQKRVFQIFKWIVEGYTKRRMLFQLIAENKELFDTEITERHTDNYIAEARKLLKEKMTDDADFELDLALNRLEGLFTMNYKIHDFKECRSIIMDRAKLLGIVTDKKDITTNGKDLTQTIIFERINGSENKTT